MTISGIDKQIMILRSPDVSREVSAMQKKVENSQDFLAVMEKERVAQEHLRVPKAQKVEMKTIRTGDDAGSGYGISADITKYENSNSYHSLLVAPGNNIIDIKI